MYFRVRGCYALLFVFCFSVDENSFSCFCFLGREDKKASVLQNIAECWTLENLLYNCHA